MNEFNPKILWTVCVGRHNGLDRLMYLSTTTWLVL